MAGCVTTAISGKNGSVSGLSGSSEVKTFKVNLTMEALDATNFETTPGWKQFADGLQGGNGTMTAVGAYFPTGADAGVAFITKAGKTTVTGDIKITNSEIVCEVDGLVTFNADFTFCGEISVTNA